MMSDSMSTDEESFDWPMRRSTKMIGTSPIRKFRRFASYNISVRNEYPSDTRLAIGTCASASRRQHRKPLVQSLGDNPVTNRM